MKALACLPLDELDSYRQEEIRMSSPITIAGPRPILVKVWYGKVAEVSSFAEQRDAHESMSVPNRGIVLAMLLSSVLWAALILAGREVWLLLH
jgi:hypothetical protein